MREKEIKDHGTGVGATWCKKLKVSRSHSTGLMRKVLSPRRWGRGMSIRRRDRSKGGAFFILELEGDWMSSIPKVAAVEGREGVGKCPKDYTCRPIN